MQPAEEVFASEKTSASLAVHGCEQHQRRLSTLYGGIREGLRPVLISWMRLPSHSSQAKSVSSDR